MESNAIILELPKTRQCRRCHVNYSLSDKCFNKRGDDFQYLCKKCDNERSRSRDQWHNKNGKTKIKRYRKTLKGKFQQYKSGAKARDLPFRISLEEFSEFWNLPCTYCGEKIETIGLDRVDPEIGYIKSNLIPCCSFCNISKRNKTVEEFFKKITKIYEHSIL